MKRHDLEGKNKFFTRRMFYRFLIPSLLSSIGLSLGNIVDALAVGTKMGETGLAAIGLVAPVFMIFNVLDLGMAIGGSVEYSRLLGEGKATQGMVSFNQMLYGALFVSIIAALAGSFLLPQIMLVLGTTPLDGALYEAAHAYAGILFLAAPLFFLNLLLYFYIRCDNNQTLASIGFIVGNAIDIILSFVFVITFNMGVEGAALATVIGKAVAVLIYLPHIFSKTTFLRLKLLRPDLKFIWNHFKNGFASSSQFLFQFFLLLVMNNLIKHIGKENGLAVFNVVINISYLLFSFYEGMGSTLQPLAGTFYGEKNKKAEAFALSLTLRWGFLLGTAAALGAMIWTGPLCALFGLQETAGMGMTAIRLFCISTIPGGFSVMMGYYFQAVGRSRLVFLINFLRTFALYLLFGLLFGSLGLESLWWTFPAMETGSLLLWGLWKKREDRTGSRAARIFDEERVLSRTIEKNDDFSTLSAAVEEFCDRWSASFSQKYYVNLTVEELCQTIIMKGFSRMKYGYIELTLIANEDNSFELHIRDNAAEHNPFATGTRRLENGSEEGLENIGVLMVKSKAKEFFYRRYQGFNTLMVKV